MLEGKKVLIAVCGSIAAYKTAFFVRLLVKSGAEVQVIMTKSAKDFITPLTLATLSKRPVLTSFYKNENGEWYNHVELGLWADLIVIAPMSANTLGKLANGLCDNLLSAVYLSARCPVMVCPAMDLDMYQHPTTQHNLSKLTSYGNIVIEAEDGELASGLSGQGRMAEPEHIMERITSFFGTAESFKGKKVVITSGPTHEPIDPVRFIGNHSTGKMGTAIALELASRGAQVQLVSGPTLTYPKHRNIQVTRVTSAQEMYEAAKSYFVSSDIAIFTAAVADYRPGEVADSKIKKTEQNLQITLVPNPDIAKELGAIKDKQFTVGFALETDNEETNALGKLKRKNLDMIVLNSLNHDGAGFAHDTNKVSIFDKHNNVHHFELKTKTEVAKDLVDLLQQALNE
ncbi:bifunctional phosphopantothenoylcysteine decarboxylase/phosphopantothenate--cysteine ligase CoaBC [Marinoscillum furvescens]|uniref:Coenzyme A biosynthesis bifunctional protein CoaBC n=1 Tax=Marinoscillum furvescens DSM 4134 TaxID=1122208 RepID=A0A3D9KX83_MARFU|nr:bifunctional phosphopantothenoylcysteine decarboxylase/phosphopantothenate--cysteine ligase CoaBC [Marinoscillum furvescens]RED93383.1 phosphopantothenoylcysteine decarboxylase/phosphopantothenate--cysteine ligase [Marinoscillum furvescens DSM 4134]